MSWPTVKIGEVADVIPGFAFKSKELSDQGVPLVKIGNIQDDGRVDLEDTQCLPESLLLKKHEKYKLCEGDVVLAMTGATAGKAGRVRNLNGHLPLLNQRVAKFVPKKIDPDFLWFAIGNEKYRAKFYGLGGGAAQPNMSGPQIANVEIPFPDLRTQEQIAHALSAYDDLIENNRRRIALLEEAARLIYREWFVHLRFPGHEHVKITDGVPEGWTAVSLEDVLILQRGFDLPVSSRKDGDIPVYGSTGIVGTHDVAKVKAPMVITGRSGSLGQVTFVSTPSWPLNTSLWAKEFRRVSPLYAYFLLLELDLKKYGGGASVPTLDRKVVHKLPVRLPSKQFLTSFDEIVAPIFAQVEKLNEHSKQLAKARDILLPRLMDGRLEI